MDNNSTLIGMIKEIIILSHNISRHIHKQNFFASSQFLRQLTNKLVNFMNLSTTYTDDDMKNNLITTFNELVSAQSVSDYVFLSDLLEFKLLPVMSQLQAYLVSNADTLPDYFEKNCSYLDETLKRRIVEQRNTIDFNKYSIEYTAIGSYTLKFTSNNTSRYFHTNGNSYAEAELFAEEYSENDIINYTVFGFGLGYHIDALLNHDLRYSVKVLETDLTILCLAFTYMDLSSMLSSKRMNIIYVENISDLGRYISGSNTKLLIHYPSLQVMEPSLYKTRLEEYFMNLSSTQNFRKLLRSNFYYNEMLKDNSVDDVSCHIKDNTVIYLGGGPSLQERLCELKEMLSDGTDKCVICAGTVYRKLVEQNIIPDYVIITDPAQTMVNQLKDIPETSTSLLYLSTASSDAVAAFNGKRYIIYQKDYNEAEELAIKKQYTTFQTGGSVSTTAIDIAITFKCKKLICLGLDLAFKKNASHAFGLGSAVNESYDLLTVPAVDGGTLQTANNLNIYRKWIERRIQHVNDIEFINMSRGAIISGMKDI